MAGVNTVAPVVKTTISVASYNIHKCVGSDGKFNPDRIVSVLLELDADVVALQEADMRFGDRRGLLNLKILHDAGGYLAVPHLGPRTASHGWHGNVVLYREGIVSAVDRLKLPDLNLKKSSLRVIAAHLGLLRNSRAKQIEMILQAAQPEDGRPVVVMGDMNEWRLGRKSALRLFSPHLGPIQSGVASFPAKFPIWSLDRVLASPNLKVRDVEAHYSVTTRIGSSSGKGAS
jgi:endonuclease/exonuclease/phosphatase family metal-dependent hydrolase